MSSDDLPVDVLTELGRVTWEAIKLEDYIGIVCSAIYPTDPRTDKRPVGDKIKYATEVVRGAAPGSTRNIAEAWLERAGRAIERRNAILHARPLVWFEPGQSGHFQFLLGEMPRGDRAYVERPLTVESLAELRSVLVEATDGWRELVLAVRGLNTRASRDR